MRFYVYTLYSDSTGPFYVGKGHGNRWRQHVNEAVSTARSFEKSNPFKARVIRKILKAGDEVKASLSYHATEAAALADEVETIARIGRRVDGAGPLTNLTRGGDGVSGYRFSAAACRANGRRHAGENNFWYGTGGPMAGRAHTQEARDAIGAYWRGRKRSAASAAKQRARRGEVRSDVTRARLRAAWKLKDREALSAKLRAAWVRRKARNAAAEVAS